MDGENVSLDGNKAAEYVKTLSSKYNTAYTKRAFKTSYGPTVEISGFYGWRINQAEETKELLAVLAAGENVTREPVYMTTAASHDGPDYGGTYAEVNLTAQHLFFYKDGQKVLESDFVSGSVSKGHITPPGIFGLTYKQRNAVLKGEGYASPVNFWMPFNGGIGFHDASWRSSFGGSIYRTGGSHGCVNMPYAKAKELFENVYTGMPVICYDLPGTESASASKASGKAPAPTPRPTQAQHAPAPSQPVPPSETAVPETQPAETPPVQTPESQPAQPAETLPQVSVDPVGQPTQGQPTQAQTEGTQTPGSTGGYGPGFETPAGGGEAGPGVE